MAVGKLASNWQIISETGDAGLEPGLYCGFFILIQDADPSSYWQRGSSPGLLLAFE